MGEDREDVVTSSKMTSGTTADAFQLIGQFLREDAYYLDSRSTYGDQGEAGLKRALALFLERPELGFVWLTPDEEKALPLAACVASFAISTSSGSIVAKPDDMFVTPSQQIAASAPTHLANLKAELMRVGVGRIDTSVHARNEQARRYTRHGFASLGRTSGVPSAGPAEHAVALAAGTCRSARAAARSSARSASRRNEYARGRAARRGPRTRARSRLFPLPSCPGLARVYPRPFTTRPETFGR